MVSAPEVRPEPERLGIHWVQAHPSQLVPLSSAETHPPPPLLMLSPLGFMTGHAILQGMRCKSPLGL